MTCALRDSTTAGSPDTTVAFGRDADHPLVSDFDGDGDDTPGVHRRQNTFFLSSDLRAGAPVTRVVYGSSDLRIAEHPIVGDWDGDGTDTIGLLRNSNTDGTATVSFIFGSGREVTVPGCRERLTSR